MTYTIINLWEVTYEKIVPYSQTSLNSNDKEKRYIPMGFLGNKEADFMNDIIFLTGMLYYDKENVYIMELAIYDDLVHTYINSVYYSPDTVHKLLGECE